MTLETLRAEIATQLSAPRWAHTKAVEEEVLHLARLFALADDDTHRLCIAALLHDITKELSPQQQIALASQYGLVLEPSDLAAPKVLHAITGAALATDRYGDLADAAVAQMILSHTTGRAGMTLSEKLLYLADYIEPTRTFADCVTLRNRFYDALPATYADRAIHLDDILLLSFDMTIGHLTCEKSVISPRTVAARNDLLMRYANKE